MDGMATKKQRELIFNKYGGKCAYCGCELAKGWHIDKFVGGFLSSLNRDSVQYRIAKRYGFVEEVIKPVVFYFETCIDKSL